MSNNGVWEEIRNFLLEINNLNLCGSLQTSTLFLRNSNFFITNKDRNLSQFVLLFFQEYLFEMIYTFIYHPANRLWNENFFRFIVKQNTPITFFNFPNVVLKINLYSFYNLPIEIIIYQLVNFELKFNKLNFINRIKHAKRNSQVIYIDYKLLPFIQQIETKFFKRILDYITHKKFMLFIESRPALCNRIYLKFRYDNGKISKNFHIDNDLLIQSPHLMSFYFKFICKLSTINDKKIFNVLKNKQIKNFILFIESHEKGLSLYFDNFYLSFSDIFVNLLNNSGHFVNINDNFIPRLNAPHPRHNIIMSYKQFKKYLC